MYAENNKISLRQFKRLFVFDLFGVISLTVPYIIINTTAYDGILAIVIGGLILIAYFAIMLFFAKHIQGDYLTFSNQRVGKVLTFIFSCFYLVKLFLALVLATKLFTEVINMTLLTDYNVKFIIIPLILVAAYLAYKGCEVRARLTELLYFIVLVPMLIFLIIGLREVDLANLTPLFTQNIGYSCLGGISFFLLFGSLEMILFIKPSIRPAKENQSVVKGMFSYGLQGIILLIVIAILFFVLTVGIVGESTASSSLWSTITIIQLMKLPGSLINRQDSLLLALWMLSIFTLLSGLLYYINYITKDMFQVKKKNALFPVIIAFALLLSCIPLNIEKFFEFYIKYILYIGLPQSILIPLIVIFIGKLRSKTIMLSLAFILIVPTMTSCNRHVEIEDRDFVQVMGVENRGDMLAVTYVLPDYTALTGSGNTENERLFKPFIGEDMYDIEEQYKISSAKTLDYSHLKAIVLGPEFVRDKNALEDFINYLQNNYEISKNTYVFVSKPSVNEILTFKNVDRGIGDYLERLLKNQVTNNNTKEITLGDLINSKNNMEVSVSIPILTITNNALTVQGISIIYDSSWKYDIIEEEVVFSQILQGNGTNNRVFFDPNYVMKINQTIRSCDMKIVNGKPFAEISIQVNGTVEQGKNVSDNLSVNEKINLYKRLEQTCAAYLQQNLYQQVNEITLSDHVDYLNLFRMSRYKNREIYQFYKEKPYAFMEQLGIAIQVEVNLN